MKYQVASIRFTQFFAEQNYRLVVMREKNGYIFSRISSKFFTCGFKILKKNCIFAA